MSIFTNPATTSRDNAEKYIRAVTALVEGEDSFEVMARTPDRLRDLVSQLLPDTAREREAPGKWSVLQVVRHLADSELVLAYRIRRILAEDAPLLEGFDQDLWADVLGYAEADMDEGLAVFRALRASNLSLLKRSSTDDLRRVGRHAERGEHTLIDMVRLYAGHDIVHLRQIERILNRGHQSQG